MKGGSFHLPPPGQSLPPWLPTFFYRFNEQLSLYSNVFEKTPIYTEGNLELPLWNVFKALHPSEYEELSIEYLPIIKIHNGASSFGLIAPSILGQERIKVLRNSAIKKASMDSGQIFGYGLTDPVTVVLDIDHLIAMVWHIIRFFQH
jgi:hypothetical protein